MACLDKAEALQMLSFETLAHQVSIRPIHVERGIRAAIPQMYPHDVLDPPLLNTLGDQIGAGVSEQFLGNLAAKPEARRRKCVLYALRPVGAQIAEADAIGGKPPRERVDDDCAYA